jgi:hypothetical protein
MAGCASRRGGATNVHTNHVRPPALKHVKCNFEAAEEPLACKELYMRLDALTGKMRVGDLILPLLFLYKRSSSARELKY